MSGLPAGTPRVALFADSFHEVNGAALTCRQLEAFAARQGYDFLTVCCGERNLVDQAAMPWRVELRRGRLAMALDRDLSFDSLLFLRRYAVLAAVRQFRPDIVHITSPGDVGILGAWVAHSTGAAGGLLAYQRALIRRTPFGPHVGIPSGRMEARRTSGRRALHPPARALVLRTGAGDPGAQ